MDRRRAVETVSLRWLRWRGDRRVPAGHRLPLLLHAGAVGAAHRALLLDPGALWVGVRRADRRHVPRGAEVRRRRRPGLPRLLRNIGAGRASRRPCSRCWSRSPARTRWPGCGSSAGGRSSALFLAVYLFPAIVLAIPLFVVFTRVGLRGSLVGLVLVYIAQTVPVSVYMLKNYFETIPVSLEEAAAIDGAGRLGIIRRVSLPLAAPSIMATGLYVFMIAWNEFLFALLFLVAEPDRWTVSLGLSQLADGDRGAQDGADGRVGRADPAHRDPLLRQRTAAHRGPDQRRGEGMIVSSGSPARPPPARLRWPHGQADPLGDRHRARALAVVHRPVPQARGRGR